MTNAIETSANARTETRVERHSWKAFLGLGILIVVFGIGDMLDGGATYAGGEAVLFQGFTGTTWEDLKASNPSVANLIDYQVRAGGRDFLIVGILTSAVAVTGFRRGERWAWFAMWIWPLWTGLAILQLLTATRLPGYGTPVPIISGSVILVLSTSILGLTYRKFLARVPMVTASPGSRAGGRKW